MKNNEITIGNNLIIEWVGYDSKELSNGANVYFIKHTPVLNVMKLYEVKYHESWDWLMPIVEKIENLGFEVVISRISCNINEILNRENPITSMVCGDISKKIEIVYESILQFIKWYNETNNKE